ncbi:hypothetical protein FSP39_019393 [Pinctada imbricata]|uniref:DDE-1 domain-containing protein n=1 Tax=Pinctada imbricata TaxID=66713 RepID=A0AA89BZJ0_PINIB|nr:hypothetical protein FSP39_019393 [Pinctada imbricata]
MFACSLTGEKLKPLVIGKAARPRCFKNVNTSNLPVTWEHNRKSWMTSDIFQKWICDVNDQMRRKKRKIIMFLDNATSHRDLKLSHVKLEFLPSNTTSKLQPLDLGIIRATKAHYRKLLMRRLLAGIDSCNSVTELVRNVSVLDCVHWINMAWNNIKQSTITLCFLHAGFSRDMTISANDDDNYSDEEDDIPLALLQRNALSFSEEQRREFESSENQIPVEECYDKEWENDIINEHQMRNDPLNDSSSDDEPEQVQIQLCVSYKEVLQSIVKIEQFALNKNDQMLPYLQTLRNITENEIVKCKSLKTQTTLDGFFRKT